MSGLDQSAAVDRAARGIYARDVAKVHAAGLRATRGDHPGEFDYLPAADQKRYRAEAASVIADALGVTSPSIISAPESPPSYSQTPRSEPEPDDRVANAWDEGWDACLGGVKLTKAAQLAGGVSFDDPNNPYRQPRERTS